MGISFNSGGGGGVSVHNSLSGRSTANAHPISAITDLQEALDALLGGGGGAVQVHRASIAIQGPAPLTHSEYATKPTGTYIFLPGQAGDYTENGLYVTDGSDTLIRDTGFSLTPTVHQFMVVFTYYTNFADFLADAQQTGVGWWSLIPPGTYNAGPISWLNSVQSVGSQTVAVDGDYTGIFASLSTGVHQLDEFLVLLDANSSASDISRAFLAAGRIAPMTQFDGFDATTGGLGGTAPASPTLTIPASITTPALPWTTIGIVDISGMAKFAPTPPSADHRLVGMKMRLEVAGSTTLVDITPQVIFAGNFPCRVGSGGAWKLNEAGIGAYLDQTEVSKEDEQDLVLLLNEPVTAAGISSVVVFVGWQVTGGNPDIDAGSTITVPIEPEWLWDTEIPTTSPAPTTLTVAPGEVYTLDDDVRLVTGDVGDTPGSNVEILIPATHNGMFILDANGTANSVEFSTPDGLLTVKTPNGLPFFFYRVGGNVWVHYNVVLD